MIHLRIFNVLFLFVLLLSLVSSSDLFGEISASDSDGDEIEGEENEWGGKDFEVGGDVSLSVDYDGSECDYDGLDGSLRFSEYGKIVEGEVEVEESGEYVFGNLAFDLKKGSSVVFEDGEIKIDDPGEMIDKDDVSFVDDEDGWGSQSIVLSGDGVDYMGLDKVSLDSVGYYLLNPEQVSFDDFVVSGEGKVYFFDSREGMPVEDVDGAYVSVGSKKFTIGSNKLKDSVSVKVNAENKYGLRHDEESDHIAFKSISGGDDSYITVTNRNDERLVPSVDAVGYFAIDDDTQSFFRNGEDGNIYINSNSVSISESGSSGGESMSPIEVNLYERGPEGEKVKLEDYGGSILAGNDGQIAYGDDPSYVPGKKYGKAGLRGGFNLNYGLSNTLTYNYDLSVEAMKKMFDIDRVIDRSGFLKDPKNVRMFVDVLARLPKAAKWLKTLELPASGGAAGMASGSKVWLFGRAGQNPGVFAHELTHTFDFGEGGGFEKDWAAIGGSGGVHTWSYGQSGGHYEAKATVGEYVFASDNWWSDFFDGRAGYNNRGSNAGQMAAKVAVMAKYGHIQHYDAARILGHAGYEVNPDDPVSTYNEVIQQWS